LNLHYDMIVIGSGPAGKRAAIQAAKIGKKVLLVEKNEIVGGVTVHTGTIPSKTLRETVLFLSGWRQRGIYGRSYKVKDNITADDLKQRLDSTLSQEIEIIQHQLMRNGVDIHYGHARFNDEHSISVEDHGGSVSVESEPGQTTFTLVLPESNAGPREATPSTPQERGELPAGE